jgi:hypothetical protein
LLKSGCATGRRAEYRTFAPCPRSPPSTPLASPPDEMIWLESGSVFSAIRRMRPVGADEDHVERDVGVLHHIEICCSGEKSNSMPLPSAVSLRYNQSGLLSSFRRRHLDREHLHARSWWRSRAAEARRPARWIGVKAMASTADAAASDVIRRPPIGSRATSKRNSSMHSCRISGQLPGTLTR